jgi:hypothetical protein
MEVYVGQHPKGSTERIFNYSLCGTSRVGENVFGLMSSSLQVLHKPVLLET